MSKNTLSHHQYHQLCAYMESRAIAGKIELRPGPLANDATEQLGFNVSRPKVSRTAKEIGIDLIFNIPRSNGHSPDDDDDVKQYLKRIDHKLDKIINACGWDDG